jgi:Ca2+-transporting ATPase
MDRAPRDPHEAILSRPAWIRIGIHRATITASVLGAFATALLWLELSEAAATTVSFLTLAFAQLWHVFNMRDRDSSLLWNDVVRNGYVWGAR